MFLDVSNTDDFLILLFDICYFAFYLFGTTTS